MSEIIVHDGIGFGTFTNAAFFTDDSRRASVPKETGVNYNSVPWALWGDNNDEPAQIADDIENCPVLGAGVRTEARLAVGKGPQPYLLVNTDKDGNEELEWVSDPEIADWFDANSFFKYSYTNIYNMLAYGFGTTQFILNKARKKINRVKATDVYGCRLGKQSTAGVISDLYLDTDWSTAGSYDAKRQVKVPVLSEDDELMELTESTSGYEFAMLHRLLMNGARYYPKPMHRAAKAWVKISRSIPNIKNAINLNQMSIKYLVIISETYWSRMNKGWDSMETEKKKAIVEEKYKEINSFLAGEINAGKSIIGGKYFDKKTGEYVDDISIEVIDDKMKDGKMLPDGAAADKQILFSMGFNPAIWGGNLLGDGASGGAGSGSDIREATLVLLSLLHPERQMNLQALNVVKEFNGWAKRLQVERNIFATQSTTTNTAAMVSRKITPRLVFRYNNTLLTTLDTGKQTKQTNN